MATITVITMVTIMVGTFVRNAKILTVFNASIIQCVNNAKLAMAYKLSILLLPKSYARYVLILIAKTVHRIILHANIAFRDMDYILKHSNV